MTEPTSATLVAATAVTSGTLTLAGSLYGLPADSMLASVMGAGIAMASAQRIDLTRSAFVTALVVFVTSLTLAVFLGPLVGIVADGIVFKLISIDLPDAPVRAAASLLTALGAQRWIPAVLDRVAAGISGGGK